MDITQLQMWIEQNPLPAFGGVILIGFILFVVARGIIARGLLYIAQRTESKYDDIIVASLRPFRVAWLVPLVVLYAYADVLPEYQAVIERAALFLILWVVALTINRLLNAVNLIYESSPSFTGVSIQGYLDLVKMIVLLVGIILSITLFTGQSPLVLLSGLGALTAVLLLIFRDTILSLVASIQIAVNDLIKEGDWIEVPAYDADGDVLNMSLHTIKVQNWNKTITVIPTYKMMEVSYKNWRGMQESGGRRIKRAIHIDLASIKFCDEQMIERFKRIELVRDYLEDRLKDVEQRAASSQNPLDENGLTNVAVFRAYVEEYLRRHSGIHREGMAFLVRELAPSPTGLPLEVYVFTKTVDWAEYEQIQADVFEHLLAAVSYFDLRLFQEPSGFDLAGLGMR